MRAVFIIKQERSALFRYVHEHFRSDDGFEVVLDRRRHDRRHAGATRAGERRRAERRGSPPPTWEAPGYVLVPGPAVVADRPES